MKSKIKRAFKTFVIFALVYLNILVPVILSFKQVRMITLEDSLLT